jgi:Ecdysteroid kinase-like family
LRVNIPTHADELTGAWLTDTLRAAGALTQARVTSLDTQLLDHTKGTTGQVARLRLAYDRDEPEAPRSLIAKFSATDPQARALIHGMGFYEREVRFYAQLAGQGRLRTPRCYFSALDEAEDLALLLLEDLATVRNGNWVAGCSVAVLGRLPDRDALPRFSHRHDRRHWGRSERARTRVLQCADSTLLPGRA